MSLSLIKDEKGQNTIIQVVLLGFVFIALMVAFVPVYNALTEGILFPEISEMGADWHSTSQILIYRLVPLIFVVIFLIILFQALSGRRTPAYPEY